MMLLAFAMTAVFALCVGLVVGYATGAEEQRAADQAELDSLTEQLNALDHDRHLGRIFTNAGAATLEHAVAPLIVEDIAPGSEFDLFNRADAGCEACDGLGRVPCPCTREVR